MSKLAPSESAPGEGLSNTLVVLFAFCCGAIVANVYYSQPIINMIAGDIGLSENGASLIVALTQGGYALGLLFLVPLADLVENRRLLITTIVVSGASLVMAGLSDAPSAFLLWSLMIGVSSVSVQIMIPLAAHLSPESSRGRVVGNIMSGLLLGILLARPVSSLVADHFGWRAIFFIGAAVMLVVLIAVIRVVPTRKPDHASSYQALLLTLVHLLRDQPVLRRRSLYQALMFAAFSIYWSAVPLELVTQHGWSQTQVALFALVGATGAIAAPISGRLADAGYTSIATLCALILASLSFASGLMPASMQIVGLGLTGVLLDFAVQTNMVLGQRAIYALDPASRGRLNAIYMTSLFIGGAIGSALTSVIYHHSGWNGIMLIGATLPLIALLWMGYARLTQGGRPSTETTSDQA
ncbi:MFS transporter [Cobetia sp. L2A1]|uniref:MFS transporter n=1 Tax=Cobetia sp. L2A1 TaxID=2686360 RepID=UPI00131BAB0D|nr:MFS transporter [Cobetia sp. L2A1]